MPLRRGLPTTTSSFDERSFRSGELQSALDATDVIGVWEWDIQRDSVRVDALVALLFNLDPMAVQAGAPLDAFVDAMHPDDRSRIEALIRTASRTGGFYIAEYRVVSADRVTRWVLARGQFELDPEGRPLRGRGIVVDVTRSRLPQIVSGAYAAEPLTEHTHPLERAAAACIETRSAIDELNDEVLTQLVNVLLVAIGRRVARAIQTDRIKHHH